MSAELLDRLLLHRILSTIPREQVAWVAQHGTLGRLESGDVLTSKDGPVKGLYIVLEGHLSIYVDRGAGRRKMMEWRGGDITGVIPYSRLVAPPGDVTAEEPTEVVTVPRENLREMIEKCYELTEALVHIMLDRARHFNSNFLHDEKLVSLGKLAAGLAHELNNPASAIARSASAIASSLTEVDRSSRQLGSSPLNLEQIRELEATRDACLSSEAHRVASPLELEERERSIARWLANQNMETARADGLAEEGVTPEILKSLATTLPADALDACLDWLTANIAARRMTAEIQESASRIHHLVAAVKGFTQMDRESVSEPVDISQGLANTLVVLRAKAKAKAVSLNLDIPKDLPLIRGFAGELNQVWFNLIANALDATGQNGHVEVSAHCERGGVVVRVVDNGSGIPDSIKSRIFDPFFTTKAVGEGSGLGLDIVRRLVQRHNGEIEVDSKPGRTEFRVVLL